MFQIQTDIQAIQLNYTSNISVLAYCVSYYNANAYDSRLNRSYPETWQPFNSRFQPLIFDRGFTGHACPEQSRRERHDMFKIINMGARLYDPVIARFLSPDPYVQAPFNSQNFNRYSYCLNNPLKYTDPSGEFILSIAVGAYIGGVIANNGDYDLRGWDYGSIKTWGYMAGGAVVGGIAGYAGGVVANSGIPMANTAGIISSSFTNSVGAHIYTGGQTPVSISFGISSYDITNNKWGFLGKKGNSALENIGYGLGALANLGDFWNTAFPSQKGTNLYTDKDDHVISHSAWGDSNADNLISFGPDKENPFFYSRLKGQGIEKLSFGNETIGNIKSHGKFGLGLPGKSTFWDYSHYNNWVLAVNNINKIPLRGVSYLSKILPYQGLSLNCVNVASLGAWLSGIPNIGIHPWLFHGYMSLYSLGMRPELFSYYLTSKYF